MAGHPSSTRPTSDLWVELPLELKNPQDPGTLQKSPSQPPLPSSFFRYHLP